MAYGDRTIWIGYDDREVLPYAVARHSMSKWIEVHTPINGVVLEDLVDCGWYTREIEKRGDVLWDTISDAPMSTQFAISRFFILELAQRSWPDHGGWALFTDSDVLARSFIDDLFSEVEKHPDKALFCVPHSHLVVEGEGKKVGQVQVNYSRKNWSSVMLLNREHPANQVLTLDLLNTLPGRDLHRFCWLNDDDIGYLDPKWNHLAGVAGARSANPAIVHYTNGGPWLPQYADVEYADEWRNAYRTWVK